MENTRIVSIIGMERCDLAAYLANVLESKKLRVLCIDNSCSHDLFLSLKRVNEQRDYVECDRVVYMRNKTCSENETGAFEKFDVVIIYHGLNIDYDLTDMSDVVVLMTSYEPPCMQYIIENIDMNYLNEIDKEKLFVMYRDKVSGKVDEKFILKSLGLSGVENELIIYFDEGIYNAYINMLYNGANTAKNMYGDMKAAVHTLRTAIAGGDVAKKKSLFSTKALDAEA